MNDKAVRELLDRQAINDVLIRYCGALDRMDLAALADLFTVDCIVDYGPDARLRSTGSAALKKSLERMWRWSRTSHHLSNVQIWFEDTNAASAISYVFAWHERPDGSSATILGQYHDRLERQPDGWRIARRRMFMNGCDAGFKVDIHRFERMDAPAGWVAPDLDR